MNYSNESFEHFQARLRSAVGENSFLYQLRDALFAEAFYGKGRKLARMYPWPGGWILILAFHWLKSWRMRRHWSLPATSEGAHHFLFLSTRNNHTARLFPLYREQRPHTPCIAWHTHPEIRNLATDEEKPDFHCVAGRWVSQLRLSDVRQSRKLTSDLVGIFRDEMDRAAINAIRLYFIQFLAWDRFWQGVLGNQSASVATTFEKVTHAKSFFHAAFHNEVPCRIHWIHGLRHASIQSTLSTELWCMTPGDVRFFQSRVPDFCSPVVKENPEATDLVKTIGVLDRKSIPPGQPIHFLFLGPGKEESYTKDMRMADLAVIRTLQEHFGCKIHWRFRPHPSAAARFRSELAEAGITATDFSTRHLHEDLKWSHAIASSWSSLLLDVRQTGRPIFWIQSKIRTLGAVDELIADGIGVHLDAAVGAERLVKAFTQLEADS